MKRAETKDILELQVRLFTLFENKKLNYKQNGSISDSISTLIEYTNKLENKLKQVRIKKRKEKEKKN